MPVEELKTPKEQLRDYLLERRSQLSGEVEEIEANEKSLSLRKEKLLDAINFINNGILSDSRPLPFEEKAMGKRYE